MWWSFFRKRKKFKLNQFVLVVLLTLAISATYFIYNNLRNKVELYVTVKLGRDPAPYWVANAVSEGDREMSPFGSVIAEVIDKESFEAGGVGRDVYLLLKLKTVKDRSGQYIYKYKPLSIGSGIDLRLKTTQWWVIIVDVQEKPPVYKYKKITITVLGKQTDKWIADGLKIGATAENNKGHVIAKVLDKKVRPAEVRVDTTSGVAAVSYDETKRDLEAIIEILAKERSGIYYFAENYKVKVDEQITIPFKEIIIYPKIILINKIEDITP